MGSLLSAQFLRIRRHWFTWVLLIIWILGVIFQVRGKITRLNELESVIATNQTAGELSAEEQIIMDRDVLESDTLRSNLNFPDFIGFAAKLSTDIGWFLVILYTAVIAGEDFSRRTLRSFLTRGVRSTSYLLTLCLVLWLSIGIVLISIAGMSFVGGFLTHASVSPEPVTFVGFGDAILILLRSWITYLPFIIATIFWAVLARQAGPAMGVGIGLHSFEYLNSFVLPVIALVVAGGGDLPPIYLRFVRVFSVTLGYNADVLLNWGFPLKSYFVIDTPPPIPSTFELGSGTLLPSTPWRAVAFLVGYTVLFLGWAIWIVRRRDETYKA